MSNQIERENRNLVESLTAAVWMEHHATVAYNRVESEFAGGRATRKDKDDALSNVSAKRKQRYGIEDEITKRLTEHSQGGEAQ